MAGAIPLIIIAPLTFNFTADGWTKLGEACVAEAILAAALYLKQSPLPPESQVTIQTDTHTSTTTVTPAPTDAAK